MSSKPSEPFSSGTEYECFKYSWCEKCRNYKEREDGFPALVENGGCPTLDAMEYARLNIGHFPSDDVRELRDVNTDNPLCWHYCIRFSAYTEEEQCEFFDMMKKALFGSEEKENGDDE